MADLSALFQDSRTRFPPEKSWPVQVFPQDLPFREGPDEAEWDEPPDPYVIVRLPSGELPNQDTPQKIEAVLVICVKDPAPDRQGFRDALHIVNTVLRHYGENGVVGGRWVLQYPIKWAAQEEDTHPYYFAAMALTFEGPAIFKEVPET